MQITLDKNDIDIAIKTYMKNAFAIDASAVEFAGTKDKITASISLAADTTVKFGSAEITILGDKPKTVIQEQKMKEPEIETVKEEVEVEEKDPAGSLSQTGLSNQTTEEEPVQETPVDTKDESGIAGETDTLGDVLHLGEDSPAEQAAAEQTTTPGSLFAIPGKS